MGRCVLHVGSCVICVFCSHYRDYCICRTDCYSLHMGYSGAVSDVASFLWHVAGNRWSDNALYRLLQPLCGMMWPLCGLSHPLCGLSCPLRGLLQSPCGLLKPLCGLLRGYGSYHRRWVDYTCTVWPFKTFLQTAVTSAWAIASSMWAVACPV